MLRVKPPSVDPKSLLRPKSKAAPPVNPRSSLRPKSKAAPKASLLALPATPPPPPAPIVPAQPLQPVPKAAFRKNKREPRSADAPLALEDGTLAIKPDKRRRQQEQLRGTDAIPLPDKPIPGRFRSVTRSPGRARSGPCVTPMLEGPWTVETNAPGLLALENG